MTKRLRLTVVILFIILTLNHFKTVAQAADVSNKINCAPVYGGGEICGSSTYTPAPTGFDTSSMVYASVALYSAGIATFTLSQKISGLLPKIK